jgi:DNA-binding transcriptional LysR family regulator
VKLLTRGARGVALSEAGRRLAPRVEETVAQLRGLQRAEPEARRELTIAAPSWLALAIVPRLLETIRDVRVRSIELPPPLVRAFAAEDIFDMALLPGPVGRLPGTWTATRAGELRKGLFASTAVARRLGPMPIAPSKLRGVPFVAPIYNADGTFVPVDDDCPMPLGDRTIGVEAQTFGLGLELAARCGQLVFGPVIAARAFVARGELVEIKVRGWNERDELHVACESRRVLARVQAQALSAVTKALEEE